jgi:hypothetical protein
MKLSQLRVRRPWARLRWLVAAGLAINAVLACSRERPAPDADTAKAAESASHSTPHRPDPDRCDSLKLRYELARSGSDHCEQDDECSLEPRGRFYTALDGCFRLNSRRFEGAAADRIAAEWLETGCASAFSLCSRVLSTAACRGGVCKERPPPPIPEDWARVDIGEIVTFFLPPDLVESPFQRECGNGPAVRKFHGEGLDVRVEYGYELSDLPLTEEKEKNEDGPRDRVIARTKKKIGACEATLVSFDTPDIFSKKTAPDGSWPSFRFVRALSVQNIDAPTSPGFPGLGSGTGPISLAISIEGERAHDEVVSRLFETLSFW